MNALLAWLDLNWFSLLQSGGIAASLAFTALSLRQERQSRRVGEYLELAAQHRRLWGQLQRQPGLLRLLAEERDLARHPVTARERLFLELAFVHFHTGWLLAREGSLTPLPVLARDAGRFFNRPAPAAVWAEVREAYEPEFVRFVARAAAQVSPSSSS